MLVAFYKPYGVLSRFTPDGSQNKTLREFCLPERIHPIGRLDADSEGLLLLTNEPGWENTLLHPGRGHWRTYWVQVEGRPRADALRQLCQGVRIQGSVTRPARAALLEPVPTILPMESEPIRLFPEQITLPARVPPIRYRKNIPDTWITLCLSEGKNRQVRRMTAAVGHPTLRLIRFGIGRVTLATLDLRPGQSTRLCADTARLLLE